MAIYQKDIQAKIDAENAAFVRELETVSSSLSTWAQNRLTKDDWSIEDVKTAIKAAMTVCGRG